MFYRLRNNFNCVLPHWRHLTAGLLYNDFVTDLNIRVPGPYSFTLGLRKKGSRKVICSSLKNLRYF